MSGKPSPLKSPLAGSAVKGAPAGADRLAAAGDPAGVAVAAVQQQGAVGLPREQVDVAVAVPVARSQDRGERLPAATHHLRRGGEAAVAVAAVKQQRAVGLHREDVGLAVAAEVARRDERGEALPAAAERLAGAGHEAAAAVAAVQQERAVGVPGEQVDPAVAAELGRHQGGERAPARADLLRAALGRSARHRCRGRGAARRCRRRRGRRPGRRRSSRRTPRARSTAAPTMRRCRQVHFSPARRPGYSGSRAYSTSTRPIASSKASQPLAAKPSRS